MLGVLPTPGLIACYPCNFFKIVTRTNVVNGEVNGATASKTLATIIVDLSALEVVLTRGLVAPIHVRVRHECKPPVPIDSQTLFCITPPCIQQKDFCPIDRFRQSCCHATTRW